MYNLIDNHLKMVDFIQNGKARNGQVSQETRKYKKINKIKVRETAKLRNQYN